VSLPYNQVADDMWFSLHEDRNYMHNFVLTTNKPDKFVKFVIKKVPNETIDTLYSWLFQNDLTEFYKAIQSTGKYELRDISDIDIKSLTVSLKSTQ